MYRLSNTLYPSSVLYSIYSSFAGTSNWLYTLRDRGHSLDTMDQAVAVGTTTVKQGLHEAQKALRAMRKVAPPPEGHMIIDGIVQLTGDDLVVGIDVLVSFNPETLDDMRFHRTKIRFAGKSTGRGECIRIMPKATKKVGERPKDNIKKPRRQGKGFVEKAAKIEQQEKKIREKKTEDTKPLERILEDKQGGQISDPLPSKVVDKSGRNEERKADVDDAASSKP